MVSKLDLRIKGCFGRPGLLFALVMYWSATLIAPCSARDCHTSFRRAWRDLSCQEQDEFLDAIVEVKNTGIYDEIIQVHLTVAEWTHGPAEFLPWHRYVLIIQLCLRMAGRMYITFSSVLVVFKHVSYYKLIHKSACSAGSFGTSKSSCRKRQGNAFTFPIGTGNATRNGKDIRM